MGDSIIRPMPAVDQDKAIEKARDSLAASVRERKASETGRAATMRVALNEIRAVTGARQDRPWTALSLIDQIARKGLA